MGSKEVSLSLCVIMLAVICASLPQFCSALAATSPSATRAPIHQGVKNPSSIPSPVTSKPSTLNTPEQMMMTLLSYITSEGAGDVSQPCVLAKKGPGIFSPPAIARASFALSTAMYNAWTRFHPWAQSTVYSDDVSRVYVRGRPPPTASLNEAIYTSAYLIIKFLLPERSNTSLLAQQIQAYGISNPAIPTRSTSSLIAYTLTNRLIENLKVDGSNQAGCYADPSSFVPVNNPVYLDCVENVTVANSGCRSLYSWSQIASPPIITTPSPYLFPQAAIMKTFAVNQNNILPPPPPNQTELSQQFSDLLGLQASLPDNDSILKLIAEYWIDGGGSPSPPGHWVVMAIKEVARVKSYSTSQSIRLLFLLTAGLYDSGISVWNAKRYYNTARPGAWIPCHLYADVSTIVQNQYVGPYCNQQDKPVWKWIPYQALKLNSPPFPEYPSGHSTFSSTAANILGNFTRSRRWPAGPKTVTYAPGTSMFSFQCFENGTSMYGNKCAYGSCRVDSSLNSENNYLPRGSVTLGPWETYYSAAESAGMSRLYGGIHIMVSNTEGLNLGSRVAREVISKACQMMPCTEVE